MSCIVWEEIRPVYIQVKKKPALADTLKQVDVGLDEVMRTKRSNRKPLVSL